MVVNLEFKPAVKGLNGQTLDCNFMTWIAITKTYRKKLEHCKLYTPAVVTHLKG